MAEREIVKSTWILLLLSVQLSKAHESKGIIMKLDFPNPSRSFDESKNRVMFWGYDKTIEVSFFVELDALKKLCPDMTSVEEGFLKAFDDARTRIYEVAKKTYENGSKRSFSYVLAAEDF